MATLAEVTKAMLTLNMAFPAEMSQEKYKVYHRVLSDIAPEALDAAVSHCLSVGKYFPFPTPADIREAAFAVSLPALPSAYDAWEEVMAQIAAVGAYRTPEWSSPLVEQAVRCIGWRTLCLSEDIEYTRAHFFKAYADYSKRAETDTKMLPAVRTTREQLQAGAIRQLAEGMSVK